jgi:hypothetical protein
MYIKAQEFYQLIGESCWGTGAWVVWMKTGKK